MTYKNSAALTTETEAPTAAACRAASAATVAAGAAEPELTASEVASALAGNTPIESPAAPAVHVLTTAILSSNHLGCIASSGTRDDTGDVLAGVETADGQSVCRAVRSGATELHQTGLNSQISVAEVERTMQRLLQKWKGFWTN